MESFKIISATITIILLLIIIEILANQYYEFQFPVIKREVINFTEDSINFIKNDDIIFSKIVLTTKKPLYYATKEILNGTNENIILVGDSIKDFLTNYNFRSKLSTKINLPVESIGMMGYNFNQYEELINNYIHNPKTIILTTVSNDISPTYRLTKNKDEYLQTRIFDRIPYKKEISKFEKILLKRSIYKLFIWGKYYLSNNKSEYQYYEIYKEENLDAFKNIISYTKKRIFL